MTIQIIINNIFRQDFKNPLILGRSLFGASMIFLGLLNLFNIQSFVSYTPQYLPLPSFFVILVGLILTVMGFALFANLYIESASKALAVLFLLFIVVVNLPQGDILELSQNLAFLGISLVFLSLAEPEEKKGEKK